MTNPPSVLTPSNAFPGIPFPNHNAPTTFNPSDKGSGVTLSGGNLIATFATADQSVRTIAHHSSGKFYCEFTITTSTGTDDVGIGISDAALNVSTQDLGITNDSGGLYTGDSQFYINNATHQTNKTMSQGSVVGMAVDIGNANIWFTLDGSSWNVSGNPASNTGGISISAITANGAIYAAATNIPGSGAVTANFGATAYAYTPPSGFGNW